MTKCVSHKSDIVQLTENGKIVYIFSLPFPFGIVSLMYTKLNDHCYAHAHCSQKV